MKNAIAVACLLAPGLALAHPDHLSTSGGGLLHLVTDPFHLALTAGAVALAFAAKRALRRRGAATSRTR